MNSSSKPPSNSGIGGWIYRLAAFAFGAWMGSLIGGFVIHQFAKAFFGPVPNLRLYCVLGAGLLFGSATFSKATKQLRRSRRTGEVADELGLDYSTSEHSELAAAIREMLSGTGLLTLRNVLKKEMGESRVVIADLKGSRIGSSGSSSSPHPNTQTVALFESPDVEWPSFTLQPEGAALKLFSMLTGIQDIDFEEAPQFSAAYHLTGIRPELVRPLFTPELLQYFATHPGLEIRADRNRLLLVHPGGPCDPEQIESFLQQATEVFGKLVAASVQTRSEREAAAASHPSPLAAPGNMSGLVGAMVRQSMVTPDELHAFVSGIPPRRIPPKIRRRRYSGGSAIAGLLGMTFAIAGGFFAVYSACYARGPWNDNRVVPLIFAIVFPVVGLPMAVFAIRYRYVNWRLLRHGVVTGAAVLSVEPTGVTVNNQQQYRMRVRFDTPMGTQESTCYIYGRRASKARSLAERNENTRILYDPDKPRRILWVDSLLFDFASF